MLSNSVSYFAVASTVFVLTDVSVVADIVIAAVAIIFAIVYVLMAPSLLLNLISSFAVAYIFAVVAEVDFFAVASSVAAMFKCGSCL